MCGFIQSPLLPEHSAAPAPPKEPLSSAFSLSASSPGSPPAPQGTGVSVWGHFCCHNLGKVLLASSAWRLGDFTHRTVTTTEKAPVGDIAGPRGAASASHAPPPTPASLAGNCRLALMPLALHLPGVLYTGAPRLLRWLIVACKPSRFTCGVAGLSRSSLWFPGCGPVPAPTR